MKNVIDSTLWTLFKKELKTYFILPIAYIFITTYIVVNFYLFFKSFFVVNQADMRQFFELQPIMLLFFIPALTMRLWAEEKKEGTFEYLMTLPSNEWNFILGKFFSSWVFMLIVIFFTLPLYITVSILGNPDHGVIIASYIGLILLSGSYISIGLFISSLTYNQIVSFILSVVVLFSLWIIGEKIVLYTVPSSIANILEYVGLGSHYDSLQRGVIDLRDIVYYLSVMVLFLFLNKLSLETRKWE